MDILGCYSPMKIAFVHVRTIDEYDVSMPVSHVDMTWQISCGDITMLGQEKP